jgi:alkanesulfonate monooxygenase SsuD/methylene tetrahydromethanopterin reductase-like flavin-dependent oxidoreductase (luciferase family)
MVLRRTCIYEEAKDWRLPAEAAAEDARVFNGLFYNAAGVVNGFPTPMDPATHPGSATPPSPESLRDSLMFGPPDQVIERIRRYERLGVDHYCYGASFGLPHEFAMRSLELFGREVMPHFPKTAAPAGGAAP